MCLSIVLVIKSGTPHPRSTWPPKIQSRLRVKRHTEKGTCPESLQYRARAKIRADNDFILDIKRIRKDAEQEVLKALTRFHQREIDRYRIEIKKSKRPRISEASNPSKTLTKTARSASAANNNVTIKSVEQIAENIQAGIAQFSEMMEKLGGTTNKQVEKYTCVFSDSRHKHGAIGKRSKTRIANKKRKERKKNQTVETIEHKNRGEQKTYQKPLRQRTHEWPDKFTGKRAQIHPYTRDKRNTS